MLKIVGALVLVAIILFINKLIAQKNDKDAITIEQLKSAMESDSTLVILDVRMPDELTGPLGQIKNIINIPVQELSERMSELEKYKEKNLAVVCRSGNRSGRATSLLLKSGYKAKNVLGGMIEYNKHKKNKE